MIKFDQEGIEQSNAFLRHLLTTGVYVVKFRKVDGSERVLKCTLDRSFLPPEPISEGTKRKVNVNVLSVWDIENAGWRSFKIDNIISVEKSS